MSRIDNLDETVLASLARRIEQLETQSPLGNTSVTDGQTEFNGDESVAINGSGRVTGVFYIDGRIVISGAFDLDGIGTVAGDFTVTGPSTFVGPVRVEGPQEYVGDSTREGDQAITGKTEHEGEFDLFGDMTVRDGGKVTVKGSTDMVIGLLNNGQAGINFGSSVLYSDGVRTAIRSDRALVGAEPTGAQCSYDGNGFRTGSTGSFLAGLPPVPAGLVTYGIRMDSTGRLYHTAEGALPPGDGGGGPIEA